MRINENISGLAVPIDSIKPDARNARLHDEANLAAIAASLEKFGQVTPIVIDRDRNILKGNGTYIAAKRLGADAIAAILYEGKPDELRAYTIADNRTSELAAWDYPTLIEQLKEIEEYGWLKSDVGFDESILDYDKPIETPKPASKSSRSTGNNDYAKIIIHCPAVSESEVRDLIQDLIDAHDLELTKILPPGTK